MTIIRDINGNRTEHTLGHFTGLIGNTGQWHQDSTGLYCIDYMSESCGEYCAMIRPETPREHNAVKAAQLIGTPRP